MNKTIFVIITASVVITGCETFDKYSTQSTDMLKEAGDHQLILSEKAYCNSISDGALSRRYGENPEIQKARDELCDMLRQLDK